MNFEPSAERGAALDQRMRGRLAESLDYLFGEVGGPLGVSADDAAQVTSAIRTAPQSPNLFGTFYDLVLAIEDDDADRAGQLAADLLVPRSALGTRVASVEERSEKEVERYRRLLIDDPRLAGQPDPELLNNSIARIEAGFALLDAGFPEMAAEIRALLREIVIAAGPQEPGATTFDGASSYMMWGAILLNARGQTNILDTAQALAHESGHNLLFGFCASESLVENSDDELFGSPLRADPRPMDGVFHATYVVARMHQTVSRLLQAGVLDQRQVEAARLDLAANRRAFDAGDQVIRESGRLTSLGAEVIETARAYMAAAA